MVVVMGVWDSGGGFGNNVFFVMVRDEFGLVNIVVFLLCYFSRGVIGIIYVYMFGFGRYINDGLIFGDVVLGFVYFVVCIDLGFDFVSFVVVVDNRGCGWVSVMVMGDVLVMFNVYMEVFVCGDY